MDLTKVMACPKCRGSIRPSGMFFACESCGLAYPVVDGIPDMLISEAWELTKARHAGFRHTLKL